MPLIALQAIAFASVSTAFRAATDAVQGLNRRLQALPIAALTPVSARISASFYRCVIGLVVALACGYVIGFRFHRGPLYITAFCLLVPLAGAARRSWVTSSAQLRNPQRYSVVVAAVDLRLSVGGTQPLHRFPEWIQPIVRDQPVSQLVYALQALAGDTGPGGTGHVVRRRSGAGVGGAYSLTLPWAVVVYHGEMMAAIVGASRPGRGGLPGELAGPPAVAHLGLTHVLPAGAPLTMVLRCCCPWDFSHLECRPR
jgi:ABC-2 type transport system permease protein